MKKPLALLLAITMFAFLFAGCATKPKDGISFKGNEVTVILKENPTTGYQWSYTIGDQKVLQYVSDIYTADKTSENTVGAGGKHTFVFKGVAPGKTTLTFSLDQPWEGGTKGAEKVTYQIEVGKNGKILSAK